MTAITLNALKALKEAGDKKAMADLYWDWFCSTSSLPGRAARLAPSVLRVAEAMGLDFDRVTVDFKNNCPAVGSLYDSCQFHDGDDMIAWYTPASGHKIDKGLSELSDLRAAREQGNLPGVKGTKEEVIAWAKANQDRFKLEAKS